MKKINKINLGLVKLEHHYISDKHNKKPEKQNTQKKSYKPMIESDASIELINKCDEINIIKKTKEHKGGKPIRFLRLKREIHFLFDNIIIFNALLSGILIFAFSYVVLMVLNLNTKASYFIPIPYIFAYLYFKLKQNRYLKIEKKYPILNEKLRTAVDNIYVENEITNELRKEIYHDVENVDYGSFFNEKRTSYKILLIIVLLFSMILLAQYDVEFDFNIITGKALKFIEDQRGGNESGLIPDIISASIGGADTNIFGEESLAELGDSEQTINMNRVGNEIDINDILDVRETEFEDSLFPEDIAVQSTKVYVQKDLKEHKELVKNYFKNMAKS